MNYPITQIRSNFPILSRKINHQPLIYLDNAASTQKPNVVIDCERNFYQKEYSAVHRGIYTLSNEATTRIENIRNKVAQFIHAKSPEEIVFVKGATEGINLVANSWGRRYFHPGDNIIVTEMEHHSNIVPWKMLAKEKQLTLRFIPILPNGTLDISVIPSLIDNHTRLLAITQVSNVLGTINPLSDLIAWTRHLCNAIILIDGAQGIVHNQLDVQTMDCDFYVFSGHKIYGPSGIGVLYGKKSLLDMMPPWEGGGAMVQHVSLTDEISFLEAPWKFEAGSPNTSGIIGLGAAIDYIEQIGLENIHIWEKYLMIYALETLRKVPDLILYGVSDYQIGIIAFNLHKYYAYDVGSFLDAYGIAIRTGHHCAMPLMSYFNVSSMCRVSLAMYNSLEDIDRLVESLLRIRHLLG